MTSMQLLQPCRAAVTSANTSSHSTQEADGQSKTPICYNATQHSSLCTQNTKGKSFQRDPPFSCTVLRILHQKNNHPTFRKVNIVTETYKAFKTEIILNTCPAFFFFTDLTSISMETTSSRLAAGTGRGFCRSGWESHFPAALLGLLEGGGDPRSHTVCLPGHLGSCLAHTQGSWLYSSSAYMGVTRNTLGL